MNRYIRRVARIQTIIALMRRNPWYGEYYLAFYEWVNGRGPCPEVPAECNPLVAAAIRQQLVNDLLPGV